MALLQEVTTMAASHSVAGLQARAQAVVDTVVVNAGVSMRPPGKLYVRETHTHTPTHPRTHTHNTQHTTHNMRIFYIYQYVDLIL